jgi:ABC-2 type transport system permease protein
MRLDKVWVVARKDLAEFLTNKYIMFTLIFMPVVMSVIVPLSFLPAVYGVTLETGTDPYELNITSTTTYMNQNITGIEVRNATIENCTIRQASIYSSVIRDSTVVDSRIYDSELRNVTAWSYSVIRNSNLWTLSLDTSSQTVKCRYIDDEPLAVRIFINVVLNSMIVFFMMIPAIIPTVIASYSFVGEKSNRSLEPLLATPTTDAELLVGKSLSIFIPTMAATLVSFAIFTVFIDVITTPALGFHPVPTPTWLYSVFILGPLFAIMSIALNVFVSSKVSDVRASQQFGSLVILPLVAFLILAIAGVVPLSLTNLIVFTFLILAIDVAIVWISVKTFKREEILVRWK